MQHVDIRKSAGAVVRTELKEWRGRRFVDIREWLLTDGPQGQEAWAPTRKGVTFNPDLLPEVVQALKGLLPPEEPRDEP